MTALQTCVGSKLGVCVSTCIIRVPQKQKDISIWKTNNSRQMDSAKQTTWKKHGDRQEWRTGSRWVWPLEQDTWRGAPGVCCPSHITRQGWKLYQHKHNNRWALVHVRECVHGLEIKGMKESDLLSAFDGICACGRAQTDGRQGASWLILIIVDRAEWGPWVCYSQV